MSINLYNTGVSGLLAAQQQLATTGHNISNVNTEGYSRQRAEQNAAVGLVSGSNYVGSGTYIDDISRIYDQFSYKEQLNSSSQLGNSTSSSIQLSQLNDIMSFSGEAIYGSIEKFYQAVNGIADNPSDLGLRKIALNDAKVLSNGFQSLNANFDQLEKSTNGEIEQIANKISTISSDIARLNEQVMFSGGVGTSGTANDLLDTRDQLVTELSKYTSVNTIVDDSGVMSVMIGNGTTLVSGITAMSLAVDSGDPDPMQTQLRLVGPNSSVAINASTLGGEMSAKFAFRDEDLMQVRSEINRLAMAISETLNQSQSEGLDLNQQQGLNLFSDINALSTQQARVLKLSSNTGNAQSRVEITDISAVPTDEFEIKYDGIDYIMTNKSTGSSSTLVQAPLGTYSTGEGFDFIVDSGASVAGDTFIIRPTENSAALMEVTLNTGQGIAASSAIDITPSDNNVSSGGVEIIEMTDPVTARAAMPMRIDVLESPVGVFNYTVTDNLNVTSAPVPYTPPSQTVNFPSFSIEISGTPSGVAPNAPEQFFIGDAFGEGNSANAVSMGLAQEKGVINGGRETFSQSLSVTTATVGSKASSAGAVADTSEALFIQAYNRNQATSGVNLDEEAANLLKFQQAYQAASQIISTANTIFDTILAAVR